MIHSKLTVLVLFLLPIPFGCSQTNTPAAGPTTVQGTSVALGSGHANTFIRRDASGSLMALGVQIDDSAMSGMARDNMIDLPMPVNNPTPFQSIELALTTTDPAPFQKPHLDAHFYLWDMAKRMTIVAGPDTVPVVAQYVAPGYMDMSNMAETMMGVHYMDMGDSNMTGAAPFRNGYVYGYYHGQLVFQEVMADVGVLKSAMTITPSVPRSAQYQVAGVYPSNYTITSSGTVHEISLGGLK